MREARPLTIVPVLGPRLTTRQGACQGCPTSCQSACKTSCTVGNQGCEDPLSLQLRNPGPRQRA